jgi:hypothetical protein
MNAIQYLQRKQHIEYSLFRIKSDGNGVYVEDGKEYTRTEYSRRYPLPDSLVKNTKANSDKTKDWLIIN